MKIAVLTPTRGLIHSRTIETVEKNLEKIKEHESKKFFTHDRPIPDAQNELVKKALKWGADYLWFVEEDNLIPSGTLLKMLNAIQTHDCGVVAVDYPVGSKNYSTISRKNGRILWCALGCTLVKRDIFKQLKKPWFRTDRTFRILSKDPLELEEQEVPNKYGGHDIWFGMSLNKLGIQIYQLPKVVAGHMKMEEAGKPGLNKGAHKIKILDKIDHFQNYN